MIPMEWVLPVQVEDGVLDYLGVAASSLAAIASSAAIIYVAKQTKLVKQSTDAAKEAVKAAQDNAAATREALELTRVTIRQSEKSRLDARAPRVFVHYDTSELGGSGTYWWKPREDPGLEWMPTKTARVFNYEDYAVGLPMFFLLGVAVPVTITNDGPGSAPLTTMGFYPLGSTPNAIEKKMLVPPQTVIKGHVLLQMMVNLWQQFAEHSVASEFGAQFEVLGPFREDVDDRFWVVFTGSVLEPVPGLEYHWRIAENAGTLELSTEYAKRDYRLEEDLPLA
jgi:hypothetical protein